MKRLHILLTNDDGILAPGLEALKKELEKTYKVTVVAPESDMSGSGHSITVTDPLRVTEVNRGGRFYGYAVNGTPADCVKLSIKVLFKKRLPNMVVSGINQGLNTGTNVLYSGTVSAATESILLGVSSMAVSLEDNGKPLHFDTAARFALKATRQIAEKGLPKQVFLNVNVPNLPLNKIKGTTVTRQGVFKYTDFYVKRVDPRRRVYYWLTAEQLKLQEAQDSDMRAITKGLVSICPLHYDMTCYSFIDELKKWNL